MAGWLSVKRGGFLEESENLVKTAAKSADALAPDSAVYADSCMRNSCPDVWLRSSHKMDLKRESTPPAASPVDSLVA